MSQTHLPENLLKQKLRAGKVVLGSILLELKGATAINILAAAGEDFVFICTEHSAFNLETVCDMVAAANAAAITPLVRIPDLDYQSVTRLLDNGCQSLLLPHTKTGAEVRRFIELSKYYPDGMRGMAIIGGRALNYQEVDPAIAMTHANHNTLLALLIETKEAVENLDEIIVPGIDVVGIGHQDLSQSYGIPGRYDHKLLQDAVEKVRKLCQQREVAYMVGPRRAEDFKSAVQSGARVLLYGSDIGYLRDGAKRAVAAFRELQP